MKKTKVSTTLHIGTLEDVRAWAVRAAKYKSRPLVLAIYDTGKPDAFLVVHLESNRPVVEYALGLRLLHEWTLPPGGKLALVTAPSKGEDHGIS